MAWQGPAARRVFRSASTRLPERNHAAARIAATGDGPLGLSARVYANPRESVDIEDGRRPGGRNHRDRWVAGNVEKLAPDNLEQDPAERPPRVGVGIGNPHEVADEVTQRR